MAPARPPGRRSQADEPVVAIRGGGPVAASTTQSFRFYTLWTFWAKIVEMFKQAFQRPRKCASELTGCEIYIPGRELGVFNQVCIPAPRQGNDDNLASEACLLA